MSDISIKSNKLTLQTYVDNLWRDMAELYFNAQYELESMEYLTDYAVSIFFGKRMPDPYQLIIL
ncbi:hypothetical protein NYR64_08955 [Actinobacillus equuli subsp. haemolyticus]|nr:hypothetical protein [Actinobacillus equuli]WGE41849.1 hypothetical protein NYR64_08955 [Actinobacillus equuli subsp. haemolyticus]